MGTAGYCIILFETMFTLVDVLVHDLHLNVYKESDACVYVDCRVVP